MTAESPAPVMADVARLAGVSHQTVSRVVNNLPNIKPSTRKRVEDAIAALGYQPNTAARALVTRKSGAIGLIGVETNLYGPVSIRNSVEKAIRDAGYFSISVTLQSTTTDALRSAIDHLTRQSVEGIVMIVTQADALEMVRWQRFGAPLVVVEGDLSQGRFAVGVDQTLGATLAVRHLLELGHTRIAHVAGPADWTEGEARSAAWRDALAAAGIAERPLWQGDWSAGSGYRAGLEIAADPSLTAVFVANDQMAIGVLRALHESGLRVPGDISVVGFDDTPESGYLIPPLTTVRQEFGLVGERAMEILHAAITGRDEDLARLVEPVFVPRASTAPPAPR
ncbi:LacI family DNA-binding transcriptional regulator [Actinorugispora endophytica]|uniref:LacI family transcriptional regulator n=1 Tax=Actinorugispora endophytica TaxID=1605990 RepID=A0A4R6UF97_9ACTN|nr:LacI family DNA-binding transcriptional regulator [Actinorugispora endophytica]TDQ43893.1 LacI family transcriptional regulator [Actinorugispora endophytica]